MKFLKINFLVLVIAIVCCIAFVDCEEDNKRNLLLRRPVGRPGGPLSKTSTTTTPPPAQENEEEGGDEYDQELEEGEKEQDEAAAPVSTTTSTEPPKKIGPIVRPFRSNEDLLNALKRRQQNQKKGGKAIEKPTPKPVQEESDKDEEPAPVQKPAPSDRVAGARRTKFSKSPRSADNADESSSFKRPGRLSLKSNK